MGTWISFWSLFLAPLDLVPAIWIGNYNQAKGFLFSCHSFPCNYFPVAFFFFPSPEPLISSLFILLIQKATLELGIVRHFYFCFCVLVFFSFLNPYRYLKMKNSDPAGEISWFSNGMSLGVVSGHLLAIWLSVITTNTLTGVPQKNIRLGWGGGGKTLVTTLVSF